MVHVLNMTDEEKFEMYMKVPHEDLVRMKIEEERILKLLEDRLEKENNIYYKPDYDCTCRDSFGNKIKVHTSIPNNTETIKTNTVDITPQQLYNEIQELRSRVQRLESRNTIRRGYDSIKYNKKGW